MDVEGHVHREGPLSPESCRLADAVINCAATKPIGARSGRSRAPGSWCARAWATTRWIPRVGRRGGAGLQRARLWHTEVADHALALTWR